jgi:hypothetical protein
LSTRSFFTTLCRAFFTAEICAISGIVARKLPQSSGKNKTLVTARASN